LPSQSQQNRELIDRLLDPPRQPWHVRIAARLFCHCIVAAFNTKIWLFHLLSPFKFISGKPGEPARIVLTGTFFADNWVEAHVRTVAASQRCEHVWVVADHAFVPLDNVTYVSPPAWLQKTIGRVPSRSLYVVWTAIRVRANVVGGFHLLFNGLLALTLAKFIGAKAVYFCVGGWAEFIRGGVHGGNKIFNMISHPDHRLERALLRAVRRFDLTLTMGTRAKDFIINCGVTNPVEVMSGGIDPDRFTPSDRPPTYDLITVSRIAPVKRIDIFLKVVKKVSESVPNVSAAVLGDGEDLDSLMQMSKELGTDQNVRFVGRQQNIEQWLTDARIFLLTSDSEGLSLAVMEATMAGLPAVVSDVGDLADLVTEGKNGWRPQPQDVDAFADRLVNLLTDNQVYKQFADGARLAALEYTVDAMTEHWDRILGSWTMNLVPVATLTTSKPGLRRFISRRWLWELSGSLMIHHAGKLFSVISPVAWLGSRFRKNLQFVIQVDKWSSDQAADHQLKKVQHMVNWAFQNAPYYRRIYRNIGFQPGDLKSLADLSPLPTIDQNTVRDHLRSMATIQRGCPNADLVSTGGTGGAPLHFYINTDRSALEYAYLVAGWSRAGYQLGMPMAVLRGRVVSLDRSGIRHEYDPLLRHHYYSSFHMTDDNMRRYLDHIATVGPCFLHVYPSSVDALARFIRRGDAKAPTNIKAIIAESEIVYPEQRRLAEKIFNCRYFSSYGHTEKLILATACEETTNYHVWPTYGYFELLDSQDRPVTTPGQRGEIVGTGFVNTVVPFIRYRTGDEATYVADHCDACGRQHPIITDIRGHRTQENLIAADGTPISWTALNMHDVTFANVRQFQFRQDTPGKAALRIVPANGFSKEDNDRIQKNLTQKLDDRVNFTIELTDAIPLTSQGKAIYVDQRIPQNRTP
jgi:phenylacetate-CoA ligase